MSVAGLGCGGPSRLGMRENKSEKDCISLVRQALDLGVNFLDTAESYGTEGIVGKAIGSVPRENLVISTKKRFPLADPDNPAKEVRKCLEQSLKRLRTDYIDIYHIHGVEPEDYAHASELFSHLAKFREEGKIRFIGITEAFVEDPSHRMMQQALEHDCWDVVMIGFNMLNQLARAAVLSKTLQSGVGVLVMFAVRRALSWPARLKEIWADLKQRGLVGADRCDPENPLGFLIQEGKASTVPEAAYRYCRHEPGVHVVLTGTGNPEHLKANIESLLKPPLPDPVLRRLREIFGKVNFLTGN